MACTDLLYSDYYFTFTIPDYSGEEIPESSSRVSLSPSNASLVPAGVSRRAFNQLWKWSESDSELCYWFLQGDLIFSLSAYVMSTLKNICQKVSTSNLVPAEISYCLPKEYLPTLQQFSALPYLLHPTP